MWGFRRRILWRCNSGSSKSLKKIETGNIVLIIADSGERYLSVGYGIWNIKKLKKLVIKKIWW